MPYVLPLLLLLFGSFLAYGQVGEGYKGVQADFGSKPGDLGAIYGFQYTSLPRHTGIYSDSYTLPGNVTYEILSGWMAYIAPTTLKSVEFPSTSRATGFDDTAAGTSKLLIPEGTWPSLTGAYQLGIPTGDSSVKLGTGSTSHQFSLGFGKSEGLSWKLAATAGDLLKETGSPQTWVNAPFFAFNGTYGFTPTARTHAAPSLKFELDYIPHYATIPSEVYEVNTFAYPMQTRPWQFSVIGRAGITPYSPSWVVAVQVEREFRLGPKYHGDK